MDIQIASSLYAILFQICDLGDLSSQTNIAVMILLFDSALGPHLSCGH